MRVGEVNPLVAGGLGVCIWNMSQRNLPFLLRAMALMRWSHLQRWERGKARSETVRTAHEEGEAAFCRQNSLRSGKATTENFFQKVIDGLHKLSYTDKCQRQAKPPQAKPLVLLSFADPVVKLLSSGYHHISLPARVYTPLSALAGSSPFHPFAG